jgi:hypothetical protein
MIRLFLAQSLMQLAQHNRIQPIWAPGHEGVVGIETAAQLATAGSEHPCIGPEPACGISIGVAKKAFRTELTKNIGNPLLDSDRQRDLMLGPSARRTKDLLKLNRDQLRWVVGLFTGHRHLKGHLFKLGLTDDPTCERCLEEEEESATHMSYSEDRKRKAQNAHKKAPTDTENGRAAR